MNTLSLLPVPIGASCRLTAVKAVVFAMAILPCLSAQAQTQAGQSPPAVVKVATVKQGRVAPTAAMPGEISARYHLAVKAEASGTVARLVELGAAVKAGEMVAELVDPVYALRLRELQQDVASAAARVRFLQAESRRLASLQKQKLASPREVEQNRSDLAQAQSQQQGAAARLRQLQQTVKRLQLQAPFAAYVTEHVAQPGEYVRAGDPVLRLISRQRRVRVSVPVTARAFVKEGQHWKVLLTDDGIPEQAQSVEAPVTTIVPSASNPSHQIQVLLDWPMEETVPGLDGQPVTVFYPSGHPTDVTLVPRDALVLRQGAAYVYRLREGHAEKLAVKPGFGQGDWIAVTLTDAGAVPLQPGDQVVVRGNERLRSGQSVRVIQTLAPAAEKTE